MNIDKEKLSRKFKNKDWNYVFKDALKITEFLLITKFKIYDLEIRNDYNQECAENLLKKIKQGKCDPDKNLFAFIWKNSTYRILEILRKNRNRKRIVKFVSMSSFISTDYIDAKDGLGNKYVPNELKELWYD